jgi:hypothetical protein
VETETETAMKAEITAIMRVRTKTITSEALI